MRARSISTIPTNESAPLWQDSMREMKNNDNATLHCTVLQTKACRGSQAVRSDQLSGLSVVETTQQHYLSSLSLSSHLPAQVSFPRLGQLGAGAEDSCYRRELETGVGVRVAPASAEKSATQTVLGATLAWEVSYGKVVIFSSPHGN